MRMRVRLCVISEASRGGRWGGRGCNVEKEKALGGNFTPRSIDKHYEAVPATGTIEWD